jgi:peptide/nickel transport system substrate-binding protein
MPAGRGREAMRSIRRSAVFLVVTALLGAACSSNGGGGGGGTGGGGGGKPQSGGDVVIARTAESQSMDKTNVFDNESIWIFEQIYEMLYEVTPDGKDVQPWLATSYELSSDQLTWTFHLRDGVKFSNGQAMTSADVKFSLDEAGKAAQGWGYINSAIKEITTPDPLTVVIQTKYPWSPLLADLSLFNNGIIPDNYAGKSAKDFYQAPIGTGPFVWDHWTKGQELKLVKNPNYWQKGKPYLDSVTWTTVGDDNTRILQLKGDQAQVDEFPPWASVADLKNTPGVTMDLFPSTRTDYMLFNERRKPFQDVHVRRAISLALDRASMVKAVLFNNGTPAYSFIAPNVPYHDTNAGGLQFNLDQAKAEMAQSTVPDGFNTTLMVGAGTVDENSLAQIIQQELAPLNIKITLTKVDPSVEFTNVEKFDYDLAFSYWTMDIADPDELVTFAVDPTSGAHSFFTDYNNKEVIDWTHSAEREFDTAKRTEFYNKIQEQASADAFMAYLYWSPYRYATSSKLHDFFVTPLGNYHMEDAWLSS